MGPYIEFGEPHSFKSNPGLRRHEASQRKQQETKKVLETTGRSATTARSARIANDTTIVFSSEVKPFVGPVIDIAVPTHSGRMCTPM